MILKALRSYGLLATFAVSPLSVCLHAQTPIVEEPGYKPTLTFDIVSIRLAPPPDANFHVSVSSPPHSSRFEVTNLPLKALVQIAYGMDAPVANAPEWMNSTLYNIQCRSDEAADARLAKITDNEVRLEKQYAIRELLTERLGLKTHMETRDSSIYNLVVAKGGLKMKPVPVVPPADGAAPGPLPVADIAAHGSQHGLEFVGTNASTRVLSGALSSMVKAPVVDKTGTSAAYNFTLQFGQPWSERDPDSWPSIFTAVQEQLGLKLEAVREAVPNLVIDHVTKPTEN